MPWPYDRWAGESDEEYWQSYYAQTGALSQSMVPLSDQPMWYMGVLWIPWTDPLTGQKIMVDTESQAGRAARSATMFLDFAGTPRLTEFGTTSGTPTTGQTPLGQVLTTASNIITSGIQSSKSGSGSIQDSVVAALNQVEQILIQNRNGFLGGDGGLQAQSNALKAFDDAWAWVIGPNGLGTAGLGTWGSVGIQDRQRGGKFDWFAAYRDPIAQDTRITDNPITGTISKAQQALGVSTTALAVIAVGAGLLLYRKYA